MMKLFNLSEIGKSFFVSLWFMFLTFPIMVIRVNPVEKVIEWRWKNMLFIGIGSFVLSFVWRYLLARKEKGSRKTETAENSNPELIQRIMQDRSIYLPVSGVICVFVIIFPFIFSAYQTNIMITALMYVVLGLGLNIVVGVAGLLNLGYAAFYAVGAYTYGLLHQHYGIGFWVSLPIGAILAAIFGILLGFPVLRLRGDYLAIVTLGFGEIVRLVLENWNAFSYGPSGIANIPRPGFFGMKMSLQTATIYTYFLVIGLTLFTIFVVNRLQDSRIGRALVALREDEIACQAMGIDKAQVKLMAFALGSTWAGMMGVVFAAKNTFINPASFTFIESAMILSIVVLGGMGSAAGVVVGSFVLILLPEYLRAFADYRMILFGAIMVMMMVFRPQGIVSSVRRTYRFEADKAKLTTAIMICFLIFTAQSAYAENNAAWQVSVQAQTAISKTAEYRKILFQAKSGNYKDFTADMTLFQANSYKAELLDNPSSNIKTYTPVARLIAEKGAIAGINGGFFTKEFTPNGLCVYQGKIVSKIKKLTSPVLAGLMLISKNGEISLEPHAAYSEQMIKNCNFGLQTGPFLITPNGQISEDMKTGGMLASQNVKHTIVALSGDNQLLVISASPMPLTEVASCMSAFPKAFGVSKINCALSLDGGRSSGFSVRLPDKQVTIEEGWPVRNMVLFFGREQ